MSTAPVITFKAGMCDVDQTTKPYKVKPREQAGYVYLWLEEGSAPVNEDAPLDLVMVPQDGKFVPYDSSKQTSANTKTNGRVFVLKFQSSSQRHMFWMQSSPQGPNRDPAYFSPRDLKIGEIVDTLLQGENVDVNAELRAVNNSGGGGSGGGGRPDDEDATMEDVEGRGDSNESRAGAAGGAGAGATGGDVREEGSGAREGGADGGRA